MIEEKANGQRKRADARPALDPSLGSVLLVSPFAPVRALVALIACRPVRWCEPIRRMARGARQVAGIAL